MFLTWLQKLRRRPNVDQFISEPEKKRLIKIEIQKKLQQYQPQNKPVDFQLPGVLETTYVNLHSSNPTKNNAQEEATEA